MIISSIVPSDNNESSQLIKLVKYVFITLAESLLSVV